MRDVDHTHEVVFQNNKKQVVELLLIAPELKNDLTDDDENDIFRYKNSAATRTDH